MNDKIIKLLYDDREDTKRQEHIEKKYQHLNPEKHHLEYGDYHYITEQGKTIVFEYKTGKDFINSVREGHLHRQVYNMCTNYDYTFIIIAVSDWENLIKSYYYQLGISITLDEIMGAIARYNTQTTVLTAKNTTQAFKLMEKQVEKLIENKPLMWKYTKKTPNYALNLITPIYGIGEEFAPLIVKELQLKTLHDVLHITYDDLISIDGIGQAKAKLILNSIGEYTK